MRKANGQVKDLTEEKKGFYGWLANTIERRSLWLIVGTVVITLLLLLPMNLMKPTELASDNPTVSDAVRWSEEISDKFPPEVYTMPFIAEAWDGDMLTQKNLNELYQNEQALRASSLSPFLYRRYNEVAATVLDGVYSLADSVNTALMLASQGLFDLSSATDLQVKQAVAYVLNNPLTKGMEIELSVKATYEEGPDGVKLWKSPALLFIVESDNEKVKDEYPASVGQDYSDQIALEHYGRDVQRVLRGEQQGYRVWGVFIDMNLEIADEGRISGVMLVVAIVLMLILITAIFRSWLITLVSGIGLGMLIIWLKGSSNLIGLKSSMMLDLIVPIAILVLGIDYAIHALFRYREEKERGAPPRPAVGKSTYGVGSALVLAMLTTVIAFGANASSGIESVVGFAIAASIAIFASLVILGLVVPAVVMRYDIWRRRSSGIANAKAVQPSRGLWMGNVVSWVSNRWFVTLPLILIVTGLAAWGWINLDTKLDPKEAFDANSDLIVGLDKLDEHVAQKAGEPAVLYIKGDFTQHSALYAIKDTIREMEDNEHVARRISDNKPDAYAYLFDYLATVVQEDYVREQIELVSGAAITDVDDDLIPDTQEQLSAVYGYITEKGIPQDEDSMLYTPQRIRESFIHDGSGQEEDAMLIGIGVPGTREQAITKASAVELQHDMDVAMKDAAGITFYGLTGEAYVRNAQFDAITNSLNRSLMIAVAACLVLLVAVFRSLRYAIVTLIPVLLVACWLYGFMFAMGYNLNMMTATIAAISIGVGIDFSIHFTVRYRQELSKSPDKRTALFTTARNTGMALFGTALSTALGFAVIAFAPMPMFSMFGVLTAVMIVLSFLMALFALPSLLLLLTPSREKTRL
ncbi:RND family transporter [Chloroflexota bacterium]